MGDAWEHPELEFKRINFNATLNRSERIARLKELSSNWVNPYNLEDLIRLRDDPRVADMRVEIQVVISQNLKLEKVREALQSINFNPFGSVEQNRTEIAKVLDKNHLDHSAKVALDWISDNYLAEYQEQLNLVAQRFQTRPGVRQFKGETECRLILIGIKPSS